MFFMNFKSIVPISISILWLQILSNSQFFLNSIIVNNFSESKFSGMYVSMMASFQNLGNNSTLPLEVINLVGQRNAVIFGFLFTIVVILAFPTV